MSEPPQSGPDAWPEAPWDAEYHDGHGLLEWLEGWRGHGWSVPHEPPGLFPFIEAPFPRAQYGPPGTAYVFTESDMLAGLVNLPGGAARWAVNRALRKLGVTFGAGSLLFWRVPDPRDQPPRTGMTFRWLRTTIQGKIGTVEQVAHVLNWRPATNPDGDLTQQQVQAHGDAIRTAWASLFTPSNSTGGITGLFSPSLSYTTVATTYLEQAGPADVTTHPGRRGPVKDFHYPRPTVLVPTVFSDFAAGAVRGSASGIDLPWEVAMCLSFKTGLRGPRNRGRLYLGPLSTDALTAGGQFATGDDSVVNKFVSTFLTPAQTTSGNRLMVVSRAYATALAVTGVSVGHIPDSQRRRRKKQVEAYSAPVLNPA